MSRHKFWRGVNPLNISSQQQVPDKIVKLCAVEANFVALGGDRSLYYCSIQDDRVTFSKVPGLTAVDVIYHNSIFYIIDVHGRIYKTNSTLENKEEIVVKEDAKVCPHGFKSTSSKVKFRNIVCSDFGQLFISRDGQLWGAGVMPQIGLDSTSVKKIQFFEGRTVYSASIGHNFAAVIARKNIRNSENCDTESENEDEVFASSCSQCQSIVGLASPASIPSLSETCPLGVQLSKSSEDSSSTTAPQTDIHVDAQSFTEDSSASTEEPKIFEFYGDNRSNKSIPVDTNDQAVMEETESSQDNVEKAANIFINADAARQFLSKQLSWVSAGEDYIVEYTEKPTRIIKENVSNITNFVVEGVKTVGDKVATLSRHVSGSSDNNEVVELNANVNPDFSALLQNSNSVCNLDDLQFSTSSLCSEKDFELAHKDGKIKNMSKLGKSILVTELWTWGDISYGQLGIGDNIKRVKPMVVMSLTGFGLQKVSCGKWHCSALTLDGRLFLWGYNHFHQVSFESRDDMSGPKRFTENSDSDRIRDMTAHDHHTLAYTHNENIYYMGKHTDGFTENVVNFNEIVKEEPDSNGSGNEIALVKMTDTHNSVGKSKTQSSCYHWRVLSSGNISYCSLEDSSKNPEFQDLSIAQRYLEEMILIHQYLVKPFLKKSKAITAHSHIYETVCDIFSDILNVTALNVLSMWQYAEKHISECDISLVKNLEEFIYLYQKYYVAISDLIVIGGFAHVSNIIDVMSCVYNLFSDQLPSNKQKNNKKISEAIISLAFVQPLTRLSSYKCIAQSLLRRKSKRKADSKVDDRLSKVISALDSLIEEQDRSRKEADLTKLFWEALGKSLEQHRTPRRRLIRESKSRALSLVNPGRFSSHWFVLFSDLFIHANGSTVNVHPLETVWVESASDTESQQNVIHVTTPEETISVCAPTELEKSEWIQALNSSIRTVLGKEGIKPPSVRTAGYVFSSKHQFFKDAKFMGRWMDGKVHGHGKVEWPDGKLYVGQFQLNSLCGHGKMEIPAIGLYEGQWKDNAQNGYGVLKYCNGDVYEGYFKDGLAHGHGVKRQGDFTTSAATIYTGEWSCGVRQGYGVMDDIGKGEKYLGSWSDNKKHGCGLIVTLDGIYYEGLFMQDVLSGHGVMVFEDGTHYEGEFRSAGVFSGKGILTFSSGDKIEGSLQGAWTEGVRISNATMHLNVSNPVPPANSKPNSFGKLCVAPEQKWNALFRQCYQSLGVPENLLSPNGNNHSNGTPIDNKKIWQNVAVSISCSHKQKHVRAKGTMDLETSVDCLEVIPQFGQTTLTKEDYAEVKQYLYNAFESTHHPLGRLLADVAGAFTTTYGGVRVHPLLLPHAARELRTACGRLYRAVRALFPALPADPAEAVLGEEGSVSAALLQPRLLPRVHPALPVLYALHNKREDDLYWRRLVKWNRQNDVTLMAFLGVDPKFWLGLAAAPAPAAAAAAAAAASPAREPRFREAVESLQQLKTTFCPLEKLLVVRDTFRRVSVAVQQELGSSHLWSMDELFPVFHFVVVRARVLQLGSEIHLVEDLLEPAALQGELGLMFTTLKACYFQILQEKMSIYY